MSVLSGLKQVGFGVGLNNALTSIGAAKKRAQLIEEQNSFTDYMKNNVAPIFALDGKDKTFSEDKYQQAMNALGHITTQFSPEISGETSKALDRAIDNYAQMYKVGKYNPKNKEDETPIRVQDTFGNLDANGQIEVRKGIQVYDPTDPNKFSFELTPEELKTAIGTNKYANTVMSKVGGLQKDQELVVNGKTVKVANNYDQIFDVIGKDQVKQNNLSWKLENYDKPLKQYSADLQKTIDDQRAQNKMTVQDHKILTDVNTKSTIEQNNQINKATDDLNTAIKGFRANEVVNFEGNMFTGLKEPQILDAYIGYALKVAKGELRSLTENEEKIAKLIKEHPSPSLQLAIDRYVKVNSKEYKDELIQSMMPKTPNIKTDIPVEGPKSALELLEEIRK